jgi:RHS repeat-associated protein
LRFPGQYYQTETRLNYNYYRDYDSATGRFIESDPAGLDADSDAPYSYVAGDPIDYDDPDGLYRVKNAQVPMPSPALHTGRILAWSMAVLYFIAYIPDPDEAAYVDFNGMNDMCLAVSLYFVACGTLLGLARWRRS